MVEFAIVLATYVKHLPELPFIHFTFLISSFFFQLRPIPEPEMNKTRQMPRQNHMQKMFVGKCSPWVLDIPACNILAKEHMEWLCKSERTKQMEQILNFQVYKL